MHKQSYFIFEVRDQFKKFGGILAAKQRFMKTLFLTFQAERGLEGLRNESRILYFVFGDVDHHDRVTGEQQQATGCSPRYPSLHDCRYESVSSA